MLLLNLPLLLLGASTVSWTAVVLLLVAPVLSGLLQRALSRSRELDADISAAHLTGDPVGLANALSKMECHAANARSAASLPGFRTPDPTLYRTHPATSARVEQLVALAGPDQAPLPPCHLDAAGRDQAVHPCVDRAADASALMSNLSAGAELASLGPVAGLARVARGEMSRETYVARYGHRGTHECELMSPRPAEDPDWLDEQLAEFARSPFDIDELLSGQRAQFDAAWQRFAARYSALPPYSTIIRGRFDPVAWAADPQRRSDCYDAHAPVAAPDSDTIRGFPGAAGRVEGRVRRLDRAEEGSQLQQGEILVTTTTNVGWTPLFPRAAAIVTDVGAPLSHAAIVARELGIPAVVGCIDATMRLKTGDRVLVDGGQGIVEILEAA